MAERETYSAEIILNTRQARSELKSLQQQQARLKEAQDKLYRTGAKEEAKALQKDINRLSADIRKQEQYINGLNGSVKELSKASYKELNSVVKALNKELRSGHVEKNSRQWNEMTKRIREARKEMQAFKDATEPKGSGMGHFIASLNKNWGAFIQIIAGLSGISMTVRKTVNDFLEMDQEMANVRKYTGQTAEEVAELNEEFKKMDTRTPREKLNQLAGAAGRLGKTSKEDIKEFVEAADTINIALGDDLGEKAVDTIGKLAIAFGDDKDKGLKGAMLATGSALNEIVQNSSAAAQPVIEFTEKLSGVGQQAHLTQAQIMGFASALDQNNQEMATSSTVMSQLIAKMYQDPARFAKMAGMNVKGFTALIKRDMNEGLIQWLRQVNKLGDMSVLAGKFDELKMDGTRAIGVLSTLAGHIGQVEEAQELATKAFEEGTSVQKEAEIQNNTYQAQMEKLRKQFKDMSIDLGKELLPVVRYAVTGTSLLTKALAGIVPFVKENIGLIAKLTLVVLAYNAANIKSIAVTKAKLVWDKIEAAYTKTKTVLTNALSAATLTYDIIVAKATGNVRKLAMAQALLNNIMKQNPFGLLLAGLTALGLGIYSYITRVKEADKAEEEAAKKRKARNAARKKQEEEMQKQVNESVANEVTKINRLTEKIHNNKLSIDERRRAIKDIQAIVPNYHAAISNEGKLYNDNIDVINTYINTLKDAARAEAAYSRMVKLEDQRLSLEDKKEKKTNNRNADERAAKQYGFDPNKEKIVKGSGAVGDMGYFRVNRETGERTFYAAAGTAKGENAAGISQRFDINTSAVNSLNKTLSDTDKDIGKMQKVVETSNKNIQNNNKKTGANVKTFDPNRKDEDGGTGGGGSSTGGSGGSSESGKGKSAAEKKAETAKAEYQAAVAGEMLAYRQGEKGYREYIDAKHKLATEYYDKLKAIYGEDSKEYKEKLLKRESEESEYYQWQQKQQDENLQVEKMNRDLEIRKQFYDKNNKEAYMNEDVLNENLFRSDLKYMQDKRDLYKKGSKEWIEAETQIQRKEKEHQVQLEESNLKKIAEFRKSIGRQDIEAMREAALRQAEILFGALVKSGEMTKEEYDEIIRHIKSEYAEQEGERSIEGDVKERGARAVATAKNKARTESPGEASDIVTGIGSAMNALTNQKAINAELEQLYKDDAITQAEYEEAKRQVSEETSKTVLSAWSAAISSISTMMSAASSYAQACSDAETAKIEADYDRQIEAAGNNTKKRERLEKEKEKKVAEVKSKAAKRAMAMEMAQAVAQTAISAINAYSSAAAVPVIGYILAPIAAAAAVAAGMLQIATIKKQHEAQQAGYYEGGYTGGRQYRREAGVVHQGEFVANHLAVNNPQLQPVFDLLDNAQRNNRVASLTAEDVTDVLGGPAAAAPVVNIQQDNREIRQELNASTQATLRLLERLDYPIEARMDMQGFDRDYKYFNRLKANKG